MDFSRSTSPQPASAPRATNGSGTTGGAKKGNSWHGSPMWLRIVWIVLLFSATILAVAMVILLYVGGDREEKAVDKEKFQAVFLTNGQVYFGNVTNVNDKYIDLKNIYYLSVDQQVQPEQKNEDDKQTNISLVKLGCELHGPVDQMIINREQVTFWENLKTDGQVSQAIDKWVEQNPEGQKCNTNTQPQSSLQFVRKEA